MQASIVENAAAAVQPNIQPVVGAVEIIPPLAEMIQPVEVHAEILIADRLNQLAHPGIEQPQNESE